KEPIALIPVKVGVEFSIPVLAILRVPPRFPRNSDSGISCALLFVSNFDSNNAVMELAVHCYLCQILILIMQLW
ncbi:hypothetical protein DVH24_024605, partial [Malus domestica]